jgi:hypothetical protein
MPKVSIDRARIADGTLPPVCVVCGKSASQRLYPGIGAPSLAWVLFSPLLGLLVFWAYILIVRLISKQDLAGLPFCDRHRGYWPRRAWFIVIGFALLVALMAAGIALTAPPSAGKKPEPHWLFGVAGCWMLVFLPAFIIVHLAAMRPTRRTRRSLVLSGASRGFAAAVEEEQRREK